MIGQLGIDGVDGDGSDGGEDDDGEPEEQTEKRALQPIPRSIVILWSLWPVEEYSAFCWREDEMEERRKIRNDFFHFL